MRNLIALASVLAAAAAGPAEAPQSAAPLLVTPALSVELKERTRARLDAVARELDGVMGYAIVDLTNGDRFARFDTDVFPSASTIKLGILYELFKQADQGRLRLSDEQRLSRSRAVPGGILFQLGTPALSLLDYANVMVIESDNTATNVLIEKLGMEAVTARMATLGLAQTKLRRYMIDIDAARAGRENVTTPADLARLLEVFHTGEGLTRDSQAEAVRILKKGKSSPIRTAVPDDVAIASKTGSLEGVRADTAIVYAKNRPFVIVAMTTWLAEDERGDKAIEELGRVAFGYFSRIGAGSEYGRQLGR
jgi:beta-lactamase class A